MQRVMTIIFLFAMCNVHNLSAQKKKVKKLSKQERKLQKYQLLKQALLDTTFQFQTTEIKVPAVSRYNTGGGYLNIENNIIRVQELDWPEDSQSFTRIREEADLQKYTIVNAAKAKEITVHFDGRIRGSAYSFKIYHSLENGSELTMTKNGREKVIYKGKVRNL